MIRLLALLALPLALSAQILVTVSPKGPAYDKLVLGPRIAKAAMSWSVEIASNDPDSVLVGPSVVRNHIPQLHPLSHEDMSLLIEDAAKNSGLERAARVMGDLNHVSALAVASNAIKIHERWPLILINAVPVIVEYATARLRGAAIPVVRNFEKMDWREAILVDSGRSGSATIFTQAWKEPKDVSFVIDTSKVTMRRSVQ